MGAGVSSASDTNAMRIVMNTYEVPLYIRGFTNIPVRKWFHVVLNCRSGLEVHVNGNLVNKIRSEENVAYMNFQDIVLFECELHAPRVHNACSRRIISRFSAPSMAT
jgi:hypothetical protein